MDRAHCSVFALFAIIGQLGCNEKLEVLHSSTAGGGSGPAAPLGTAICDAPMAPASTDSPTSVVGNGTIESCTEQALADAIALGGVVVFRCGARPATLVVSSEKAVLRDTVIDGGGLV